MGVNEIVRMGYCLEFLLLNTLHMMGGVGIPSDGEGPANARGYLEKGPPQATPRHGLQAKTKTLPFSTCHLEATLRLYS